MKELKDISKENPFKVPENYFDEVNRKIISATAGYEAEENKKATIRRINPFLAVAASVAVLVLFSVTALLFFKGDNSKETMPEITLSEFVDNYLPDIDVLTLENSVAEKGDFLEKSGLSKSDLVDYLVIENIEISEIYEKL
jgi:hypothetical protein